MAAETSAAALAQEGGLWLDTVATTLQPADEGVAFRDSFIAIAAESSRCVPAGAERSRRMESSSCS